MNTFVQGQDYHYNICYNRTMEAEQNNVKMLKWEKCASEKKIADLESQLEYLHGNERGNVTPHYLSAHSDVIFSWAAHVLELDESHPIKGVWLKDRMKMA